MLHEGIRDEEMLYFIMFDGAERNIREVVRILVSAHKNSLM